MNVIEHVRAAGLVVESRITWSQPLSAAQEAEAIELFEAIEDCAPNNIVDRLTTQALADAEDNASANSRDEIEELEDQLQDYRETCAGLEKEIKALKAQIGGQSCAA